MSSVESGQVLLFSTGFLGLVGFFGSSQILDKKHNSYLIRKLLRVKNYGLYLPIALVQSNFFRRIGSDLSDQVTYNQVYRI